MKLANILSTVNQIEQSKFLTFLEKICNDLIRSDKSIAEKIEKFGRQIKNASNLEIVGLFQELLPYYEDAIRHEISLLGAQAGLVINIISRDGNNVASTNWIETLYRKELDSIENLAREIELTISNSQKDGNILSYQKSLKIYFECLKEAYSNDLKINREAKITDDERSILNVLSKQLNITNDDQIAIEHMIVNIPNKGILDCLESLRGLGILFIRKKTQRVYVPDEIVELLHKIQNKEIQDKYLLRVLRTLSDAELSNILKSHNKKTRSIDRRNKISTIINMRLGITQIFISDMHNDDLSVNDRKDRLKKLMEDLDICSNRLGSTIEERSEIIIESLKSSAEQEFNALSATGYKDLFDNLKKYIPNIKNIIGTEFELEEKDITEMEIETLKAIGITPHDILYLLDNDQIKIIRDALSLTNRGNSRLTILENFVNATDKLIENYELLASRDMSSLKENNVSVAESEIGVKFEEATKAIFEQLGLNVDEDLRKAINSAKDKADIIISLNDDDVIIGEAKTFKNGHYAKYSSVSRQIKSYVNKYEQNGKRVSQVLIIAPGFSKDFIESAEMDTEINVSLLEASGLKNILKSYKSKKNPKFNVRLLTKGGLLKADLIASNI